MARPFFLCCAVVALAGSAAAQAPPTQTLVYEPDYFASFSPGTALDMVERVPGFMIDEGEERRGFAGAQSNVLIDGGPPVSKAQDIEDILERIPAEDVVRIELVRGAGSSAASAQGVRVNVVRRASSGSGVWDLGGTLAEDGRVSPDGGVAWSGRVRSFEYGLSADVDIAHLPIRGDRSDYDPLGALDQSRIEHVPTDEREGQLAGEASFPWLAGAASLNAQLSRVELDERTETALFDGAGGTDGAISGLLAERETVGEVGASWRADIGVWRTELAAIVTRRRFEADETTREEEAGGALDEAAQQTQRIDSGETILRIAAQRRLAGEWRLEFGAEAAFNTLEQRLTLTEDDGGGPAPVILPSANVRVEERRAEASAMVSGPLWPRWTLEAGGSVELTQLTQSGDADRETNLTYWKPSIQFVRALGERDQVRFRFYRDVGQLDFEDFVSAADITSSIVDAGNPNLRPERSWRLEAAGDWRFGEDGAFGLTIYRWFIEDAFDLAPIGAPGDQFDAPGNIGDADAYGAHISFALPLPLDSELRVDAMAQRSDATDPLTGESRAISGFDESALIVGFRQDVAAFAWGVDYERETEAASYRLDRVEDEQDAEELSVWIETTAFGGVKLRAWGANLTDDADTRGRRLFDPDRLGVFDGSDRRARGEGVSFGLSASGRF
jgi:outer membrane receptor protein involved in Fe transport